MTRFRTAARPPKAPGARSRFSVTVQTLISIVVSMALTALIMYGFVGADLQSQVNVSDVWRMGMSISILAPAFISPLLAIQTGRLLQKLQEARDEMEDIAKRDYLTGLLNRHGLQKAALEIWRETGSQNAPVGALMCDIDRFKSINDHYGHDVGDLAIKHVSRILRETVRHSGSALGRQGGEEFAVLLPDIGLEEAGAVAESLRRACEANPLRLDGADVPVTISVGVAIRNPGAATLEILLADADKGLYRAKAEGRNRVATAEAAIAWAA